MAWAPGEPAQAKYCYVKLFQGGEGHMAEKKKSDWQFAPPCPEKVFFTPPLCHKNFFPILQVKITKNSA